MLQLAVQPGGPRDIVVQALPNATCTLSPGQTTAASNAIEMFSDADGTIIFQIQSTQGNTRAVPAESFLYCSDDAGVQATYLLQITIDPGAAEYVRPLPRGTPRPALTADPAILTTAELVAKGFPPKPDPIATPEAYQTWLKIVSEPATIVPPRSVRSAVHNYIPVSKDNYAGISAQNPVAYRGSGNLYDYVSGSWHVPQVSTTIPNEWEHMSTWVGLRGCTGGNCSFPVSTGTLFQTGTVDAAMYDGSFVYSSHSAFFEWLSWLYPSCLNQPPGNANNVHVIGTSPNQACDLQITPNRILVNERDQVFAVVWTGDANGTPMANGAYAYSYIQNMTTLVGSSTLRFSSLPAWPLNGFEADWILERATLAAVLTLSNLPWFSSPYVMSAPAVRYQNGGVEHSANFSTVANILWTMSASGRILAVVTFPSSQDISFNWVNYY